MTKREQMLSTSQVQKILKISRKTLEGWVASRKIKAIKTPYGKRMLKTFDPKEVSRVGKQLKKVREPGKSLLK